MKIRFFDQGIEDFLLKLDKPTIAKALRTFDLLEKFGKNLSMPHGKKINENLFELRIRGRTEVGIFYTFNKRTAIVLSAFVKKTRKIPKSYLKLAEKRLKSLD
ncbi:type II toxin-antitoxin system RelE/ParE family toxin [Patescibacteria group bacterium]|nr:type II toxin-antitoxin system RelE/ParE family toxin [Patescibacteria group bacterium]MBU1682342.1 type II toxin-antitoxin system RelE/ParE family toxin [Patescibacteria group bacterium]MBU1934712.1 type II toxin-antitoxin system RelE/ParE family toxin [Patescibacteria group bacterium]